MLDLPRFAVLRYDAEMDLWSVTSTGMTYDKAVERLSHWRGKGEENLYLVGLAFILGPGEDAAQQP